MHNIQFNRGEDAPYQPLTRHYDATFVRLPLLRYVVKWVMYDVAMLLKKYRIGGFHFFPQVMIYKAYIRIYPSAL